MLLIINDYRLHESVSLNRFGDQISLYWLLISLYCIVQSHEAAAVFPVEPVGPTVDTKQQPDACTQEVWQCNFKTKSSRLQDEEFDEF